MANKEHLAKLQEGVEAWNAWRKQNPGIQPDLSGIYRGVDLFGVDLRGADLAGADLSEANLRRADLRKANLRGVNLFRADLFRADLRGVNFGGAYLREADLCEANSGEANLIRADLARADLARANLIRADLARANLREVDLCNADLREANLDEVYLRRADLRGANLGRANFHDAHLDEANFREATLDEAYLVGAYLNEANFIGAYLGGADFRDAHLVGTYLNGANLGGVDLTNARLWETTFADVDLTNVRGLESCTHRGPSTIDHRTLAQSGELPLSFLRGCGLPDTFIDYLPSLLNQPIQFYSCFISYSTKDDAFARRLHADLQDKGVRCWFAPEDMKIGGEIRTHIDEVIRIHDKLLLVLSQDSVASAWVEKEVEMAFDKEIERKEPVLFPIRLDGAVMESKTGWAADIRRSRHIGNFSNWKNHDEYQKGLERLLRDLKIKKGE